ncbi:MAG: hypothetical protein JNK15_06540 [Planctomycetes bacterium]|nr:hypothetical protein [Planctomycetota bacterium]
MRMFTLQILDRGQTFLHPLQSDPVTLGSGPEAQVVLHEADDSARVRIEPNAKGARLVATAPTRVNGRMVTQADLALGDRIEIGRAVIVVGRTVPRAARPEDVLADAVPRSRRRAAAKRGWLMPVVVVLLAAGGVGGWWLAGGGPDLAGVRQLRLSGQLEQAAARLQALQATWSEADDATRQKLQAEADALAATTSAVDRLLAAVRSPDDPRGYAEWSQELGRRQDAADEAERIAATVVRARLVEAIQARPAPTPKAPAAVAKNDAAADQPPTAPSADVVPSPARSEVGNAPPPNPAPATTTPAPRETEPANVVPTAAVDLAEVDRMCQGRLFVQALALLQANLAQELTPEARQKVEARIAAVQQETRTVFTALLEEAKQLARERGARFGADLLQRARTGFPPTREFAELDRQHRELLAEAATQPGVGVPTKAAPPSEAVRALTLAALRARMDAVRTAEEGGDFAEAARLLGLAAEEVRARDADFAVRLQARAGEAELLASFHGAVVQAVQSGQTFKVTSPTGAALEVRTIAGGRLVCDPGQQQVAWHELGGAAIAAIADQVRVAGPAALGAAALLYKQGDGILAEALLAKVVRADPAAKEAVDRVLARGRGEVFDGRGYALGKDGFVSMRSLDVQKQAAVLATRVDEALRGDKADTRGALLQEALAAGPEAVEVLAKALDKDLRAKVQKLDASGLRKQVDKLAAKRTELDAARKHARDLIEDEKAYFYPYKPPAVSSDKFAEYNRVQAEVDRRVAALRTLWDDDTVRIRVPATLRAELDRIDWLARSLGDLGELDHAVLAPIDWARALPAGDSVGLREFCQTSAERAELEEWRRVEAYNTIVGKELSSAQREQLKVTNDYRAMFRHRPLAAVKTICAAAQGHAEEMAKLGYFAHMSPTPGRKTPFDRMKLAGYDSGVSENIALVDGALGAHNAWCHSSGHHRNLLNAGHREMGIGCDGRHWVQNFGGGVAHRDDPAWAVAGGAGH